MRDIAHKDAGALYPRDLFKTEMRKALIVTLSAAVALMAAGAGLMLLVLKLYGIKPT